MSYWLISLCFAYRRGLRALKDGRCKPVLDAYAHNKKAFWTHHNALILSLGLDPKMYQVKLNGIKKISLPLLIQPYPPAAIKIYETPAITDIWSQFPYGHAVPNLYGKGKPK